MAKVTFQDEEGQYLNRYKLTPVEGQANVFDLERMAAITKQGTPYSKEVMSHMVQDEDFNAHQADTDNPHKTTPAQLNLGNVDNTHDADKSVKYAATAGSAPAAGGWAQTANYPTHAVGINDFGLRGNYIANWGPSGGADGDTWDQY